MTNIQPFPLTMTLAAIDRVKSLLEDEDTSLFLRVAVKGGGCAGFTYAFTLENSPQPDDLETVVEGIKIVMDAFSAPLTQGAVLDYESSAMGGQLIVRNPYARVTCGCGASFSN